MAKGKKSQIPWTPILIVGGLGLAYWQRDKIMPYIDKAKGSLGLYARSRYANVIPYFNITPGMGRGIRTKYDPYWEYQQMPYRTVTGTAWYPYHRTHYSV